MRQGKGSLHNYLWDLRVMLGSRRVGSRWRMMTFTQDMTTPNRSPELSPLADRHLLWFTPNPVTGVNHRGRQQGGWRGQARYSKAVGKGKACSLTQVFPFSSTWRKTEQNQTKPKPGAFSQSVFAVSIFKKITSNRSSRVLSWFSLASRFGKFCGHSPSHFYLCCFPASRFFIRP